VAEERPPGSPRERQPQITWTKRSLARWSLSLVIRISALAPILLGIYSRPRCPHSSSSSFSLALFAFWLRSSVVSVLFSLISETCLRTQFVIISIFVTREVAAVLAHVTTHRVAGITLPPADANTLFHLAFGF
jgi:hypothetical protein